MAQKVFRQKSLDRINAPEDLNDYLRVTSPMIWLVMIAVIFLVAALFVWSSFTAVGSYAEGHAVVNDGVMTVSFDDEQTALNVKQGMNVSAGNFEAEILSIGRDSKGNIIAVANAAIPDGMYEVRVGYKSTQIIDFIIN